MTARIWRKDSESVVEARAKNSFMEYMCVGCRIEAFAPSETLRAEQKLCKDCFGKRKDLRENELNELTGSEWAALSKSVEQYAGTRSEKQRAHGAAFPQSLAEAQIRIYSKKSDLVLDPFAGVGTTIDAAQALDRRSIGIELNPEFANLAREDIKNSRRHKIICADVRSLSTHVKPGSVDFVLTSPPYATLLNTVKGNFAYKWREHSSLAVVANAQPYSRHESDLGNLDYAGFMDAIADVLKDCCKALKDNSYAVWVVKDYRDIRAGVPYVNFHADIIRAAEVSGFVLWDLRIYDQTKFRPLVVLGYPSRNYYLNIGHSYILVLKKQKKKQA